MRRPSRSTPTSRGHSRASGTASGWGGSRSHRARVLMARARIDGGAGMRTFHVVYTGDFLDAWGRSAYGDIGLERLAVHAHVRLRFITAQAPRRDDSGYWERLYSMEV